MTPANASDKEPDRALAMIGVWSLVSRDDGTQNGRRVFDPALGENPLGILTYAPNHFAAQFMKRDRSGTGHSESSPQGQNNTGAVGGYDAYFGTYQADEESGEVHHRLEGALTVDNVGLEASRQLQVFGDQLAIHLDTTSAQGEAVSRTLKWRRIG